MDDTSLMQIKVNIMMYLVHKQTGIDIFYAQSSIKIGEVYMYQPVSIWLSLHDPDVSLKRNTIYYNRSQIIRISWIHEILKEHFFL